MTTTVKICTHGQGPRGDVTRNPKQGYQWSQNRTSECVHPKILKRKKSNASNHFKTSLQMNYPNDAV